ncbi:hypothetical protein ACWDZ4_18760 [Streptomyces sp. NPDC003016]
MLIKQADSCGECDSTSVTVQLYESASEAQSPGGEVATDLGAYLTGAHSVPSSLFKPAWGSGRTLKPWSVDVLERNMCLRWTSVRPYVIN